MSSRQPQAIHVFANSRIEACTWYMRYTCALRILFFCPACTLSLQSLLQKLSFTTIPRLLATKLICLNVQFRAAAMDASMMLLCCLLASFSIPPGNGPFCLMTSESTLRFMVCDDHASLLSRNHLLHFNYLYSILIRFEKPVAFLLVFTSLLLLNIYFYISAITLHVTPSLFCLCLSFWFYFVI